jgi:putative ABC transport system substrate-binding protein
MRVADPGRVPWCAEALVRQVVVWTVLLLVLLTPAHPAPDELRRPLVAVLDTDPPTDSPLLQGLGEGLHDLGYVEGRNLRVETRTADGHNERLPTLVGDLVALKPELIVSANTATTLALKGRTGTLPVVMCLTFDPVGLGVIQSLARPGGTFTGLSSNGRDLFGKRIELLKELVPAAQRLLLLWTPLAAGDPDPRPRRTALEAIRGAAAPMGIEVVSAPVRTADELREALAALPVGGVDALLVLRGGILSTGQREIAEAATQDGVPTMFTDSSRIAEGGLIGYGPDYLAHARRAAAFVDKLLKGADPAELPVEQAMALHLAINLRTAKALGLTVPEAILARADEVVE